MRLIKLAATALFGYALFEFFRGMLHEAQIATAGAEPSGAAARSSKRPGGRQRKSSTGRRSGSESLVLTGPGEGIEQATAEADGGSVRHKVGRGVIS